MHRRRVFLASIAILFMLQSLISLPAPARAGGFAGTAQTNFTLVTPDNVIFFGTLQETNPNQRANLKTLASALRAHFDPQALLKRAFGPEAADLSAAELVIDQAVASLQKIFNGELALAVLPISVTARSHAAPAVALHVLFDAGLQSDTTFDQLSAQLAQLGPSFVHQVSPYRNLPVVEIDLRSLIASARHRAAISGPGAGRRGIPPIISGVFYGAVAGNDAVLATDLPTLKHSIDTYFGMAPSIAAVYDFQQTVSSLPADRFFTSYVHADTEQWRPLVRSFTASRSLKALARAFPATPGTASEAYSITAEPDGILTTLSPRVTVGSLATGTGLTATSIAEPGFLPAGTLAYFGLDDPGRIVRALVIGAYAGAMAAKNNRSFLPGELNIRQIQANGDAIIKQIDKRIGINLDDQVFSWMHGDASIALLPVGSRDFGSGSPTTTLSVVATLRITDRATVEADLAAIEQALEAIPSSGLRALQFVQVPGTSGNPLQMLALTPTGLGYTFHNGYLIVATALPADLAGIVKASEGGSLASNPAYKSAFAYFPSRPYGVAFYANLTGLRQTIEGIARASGADMREYDSRVRPILLSFKSLATVKFAGSSGGSAQFIGISR